MNSTNGCNEGTSTPFNSTAIANDSLHSFFYIVVVLIVYSLGVTVGIISYIKREKSDAEEEKVFTEYMKVRNQTDKIRRYYRVQRIISRMDHLGINADKSAQVETVDEIVETNFQGCSGKTDIQGQSKQKKVQKKQDNGYFIKNSKSKRHHSVAEVGDTGQSLSTEMKSSPNEEHQGYLQNTSLVVHGRERPKSTHRSISWSNVEPQKFSGYLGDIEAFRTGDSMSKKKCDDRASIISITVTNQLDVQSSEVASTDLSKQNIQDSEESIYFLASNSD